MKMNAIGRRELLWCLGSAVTGRFACGHLTAPRLTESLRGKGMGPQEKVTGSEQHSGKGRTALPPVVLDVHDCLIIAAQFSRDGSKVAAIGNDCPVRVWDALSGRLLLERQLAAPSRSIAINRQGTLVASGGWARTEYIRSGLSSRLPGGAVVFSGSRALASFDGLIRIWEVPQGLLVREIALRGAPPKAVAFDEDRSRIVSLSEDNVLTAWDIKSGSMSFRVDEFRTEASQEHAAIGAVSISADANCIAALHTAKLAGPENDEWEHRLTLWDLRKKAPRVLGVREDVEPCAVAVNGDCSTVATLCGSLQQITVRSLTSGKVLHQYRSHSLHGASFLSFNPAGTMLVAAGISGAVVILDSRSGRVTRVINGQMGSIHAIAFAQGEYRMISGGDSFSAERDRDSGRQLADRLTVWDSRGR
jgi:WD40 repeat protein